MKSPLQPAKSFGPAAVQRVASNGLKIITDNRPAAVAQRKLQQLVQRKGARQLKVFQGASVVQRAVEPIPGSGVPPRWRSTLIHGHSFDNQVAAQAAEDSVHQRQAAMTPLPLAFGSGAPYGFHGFPEMGTIPRADVPQVQERVYALGSMLHTLSPQNRRFNTSEPPRAPTMYFQAQGLDANNQPVVISSGRVRQEHDAGPAVYVDAFPRQHLFSNDRRLVGVDHQYDFEDRRIVATNQPVAAEGMRHIEIHHNAPQRHRSWEVAHVSGGRVSNAPMTPHEVDRALLRAAISPQGTVEDRRR